MHLNVSNYTLAVFFFTSASDQIVRKVIIKLDVSNTIYMFNNTILLVNMENERKNAL
jgi:hypothetical protein